MKKETLNHITDELLREYCSLGYSTRKLVVRAGDDPATYPL